NAALADELRGTDAPVADAALLVRTRRAQQLRPVGPRKLRRARVGRHRKQFDLRHARRALAIARAHAVRAGVAAADHDHVLARREDVFALHRQAGHAAVLLREEIHREMHAGQIAPRYAQIARRGGAAAQAHRIEIAKLVYRIVDADVRIRLEDHAFLTH